MTNLESLTQDQYDYVKKSLMPSYTPEDLSESELEETLKEYMSQEENS
jgi:hypothetical protein